MNIKLLVAAAAIAVAAPALAAEPFNGPFVGVEAGWQQDRFSVSDSGVSASINTDGLRYGAFVGYDFKAGDSAVVGLEVGISDATGKIDGSDFDLDAELKWGRTFDVTARAGALLSPTSLLYARGGYSNARLSASLDGDSGAGNADGWLLGAGFESMLGANASARIEYNYSQYDGEGSGVTPKRHVLKAGVAFRF